MSLRRANVLDQTVAELILLGIAAHVHKRQHHKSALSRLLQCTLCFRNGSFTTGPSQQHVQPCSLCPEMYGPAVRCKRKR